MKEKVKELRVQIDGLAQLTCNLECDYRYALEETISEDTGRVFWIRDKLSPQVRTSVDSLFLAKAWLGKVLGELGEDSPYPKDGTRKTIKDIEPTADTNDEVPFGDIEGSLWRDKNHIEKVDWLRQEISKIVKEFEGFRPPDAFVNFYLSNSVTNLSEARFWLEFELERVREIKV